MKRQRTEPGIDLTNPDGVVELEWKIRHRLGGHLRELKIEISTEGLTLRGSARTFYAKQLAQHAVMDETELPIVANFIDVQ
jgi:hypothetical protein